MDLSDRRVIAFAMHALVPGDPDGLDQPAIGLSAPSVTGDQLKMPVELKKSVSYI